MSWRGFCSPRRAEMLRKMTAQGRATVCSLQLMVSPFGQNMAMSFRQDVDMTLRMCEVVVKQVPETLNEKGGRLFFNELEGCINVERPSIVFDCSKVIQMDKAAIHLLLCCLEEAIKRNGDVKLAAIPAGARTHAGNHRGGSSL